jgi:hypothetical protein
MPAHDGTWFEYRIVVFGKTVSTYVDGRNVMKWTQPTSWMPPAKQPRARLGKGAIGLQANGGVIWVRDVVLKLP